VTGPQERQGLKLLKGVIQVFTVEFFTLPLGMLGAIILTRGLGPEIYGLYAMAIALVFWLEMFTSYMINRPTEYFLATAADWRPMASFIVRLHLFSGLCGGLLMLLLAPFLASLMNQDGLVAPLRLLALDIPVFGLAIAHRNILVGLGRYRCRAYGPLGRWLIRLGMVYLLLELGLGINGAALAVVAGSLAELWVYRYFVRPPLWLKPNIALKKFLSFSAPLFVQTISLNLFRNLDLIMLGVLLASSRWAGLYGAALNLCLPMRVLSLSLSPLLNSDLSRLCREGETQTARNRIQQTWRVIWYLLPMAGIAAACASELMVLLFGPQYADAAVPFRWLVFAYWGLIIIDASSSMLVAGAKPVRVLAGTGWLPLAALAGCLWLIPWLGGLGAAIATALACLAGCIVMLAMVYKTWRVGLPAAAIFKSVLICAALMALGMAWTAPGIWLAAKLAALSVLGLLGLAASGEFKLAQLWSALRLLTGGQAPERPD
jgi:O-antigen/teichoic acid export membrane protein